MPILYSFRSCPYAMRARMVSLVIGTTFAHGKIPLREKPVAIFSASAKGTVSVLVLHNSVVIEDNIDTLRWVLSRHDPEDWLGRANPVLVERFDDAFKHHLDRFKYASRYNADPIVHRAAGWRCWRSSMSG